MITYDSITHSFDNYFTDFPEYQEACRLISDLANEASDMELSEFLKIIGNLVAVAPFGDLCQECALAGDNYELTWPYAGSKERGFLKAKYFCQNKHYWECSWRVAKFPHVKMVPVTDKKIQPDLAQIAATPAISTKVKGSRNISQAVKIAVAVRDGGQCVYCGSIERLQYDHIIPWSKGGDSSIDNIQLLCGSHNASKRDKIIEQEEG